MNFLDHVALYLIAAALLYDAYLRRAKMTNEQTAVGNLGKALDRLSTEVREIADQVTSLKDNQGDPAAIDAAASRVSALADALDNLQDHPVVAGDETPEPTDQPQGGEQA